MIKECDKECDVVVIGGGPAGYVGAIRAAQLGASVCLVEMEQLGGTCLNHGCIPTKTLLHNAEFVHELAVMSKRGIKVSDPTVTVDMKSMMKHKNEVVRKLVSGVASLTKSYAINVIRGIGVIEPDMSVSVFENPDSMQGAQSTQRIRGKKIIMAGGSEAVIPPIPGIASSKVITNREALALETLPKHLVIIGGGVIGVEMARVFSAFGSQVTIIELEKCLVPFFDEEISNAVKLHLKKQGVCVHTSTKVEKITETSKSIEVHDSAGNKHTGDYVLVSTGRKANLAAIKKLNIKTDKGFICVDSFMETSIPGLYAPGDVNGKCMLAHAAFKMAEVAAENAVGSKREVSLKYVPQILYGTPEAATVGITEIEAKQSGRKVRIGRFPFAANGRALSADSATGFVKLICDDKYGEILGAQMFGPNVSEIINEVAVLMNSEVTVYELADAIHGHPTLSEAVMEAAADVIGVSPHLPPTTSRLQGDKAWEN